MQMMDVVKEKASDTKYMGRSSPGMEIQEENRFGEG